jgi:predicted nucleotidyltransferase
LSEFIAFCPLQWQRLLSIPATAPLGEGRRYRSVISTGVDVPGDQGNPLLYNKAMKIEELLKTKREQILEICQKHGVYDLRVFGSLARGEGNEQSDLEVLLGVAVDVVTRDSLHWFIKDRIVAEARPV